jgi:hypothetical protein
MLPIINILLNTFGLLEIGLEKIQKFVVVFFGYSRITHGKSTSAFQNIDDLKITNISNRINNMVRGFVDRMVQLKTDS